MKISQSLFSSLTLLFFAGVSSAAYYDDNYTYAQVVDVQAVYETYQVPENRRVCQDPRQRNQNPHPERQRKNTGAAVIGGIIGGLIGNRFGDGHGRDAATAAGVIAGATIGANAQPAHRQQRPNCYTETRYRQEQRIAGYDVSYDYNGKIYQARLQNHPGDRVRVQVNVQIAEY